MAQKKNKILSFSHDSNARNDERLLEVRRKHGMEGYGVYWALLEMLRSATDYTLPTDYESIAWELRVEDDVIRRIVEDYGLYLVDKGSFKSIELCKEMDVVEASRARKSMAGKRGMQSRWHKEANEIDIEKADDTGDSTKSTQQLQQDTNTELFSDATKKQKLGQKSRQKKYTAEETKLHTQCKKFFDTVYAEYKETPFYWSAKDMAGIVGILKRIRFQMPEEEKEDYNMLLVNFQAFIRAIFERADDWVKSNASPSIINSKFNEIYSQLKNRTKNENRCGINGATEHVNARDDNEYLASLLTELHTSKNQ